MLLPNLWTPVILLIVGASAYLLTCIHPILQMVPIENLARNLATMYRVSNQNYISEVQPGVFFFFSLIKICRLHFLKISYVLVNRRRPLFCPEVNFDY